MNKIVNMEQWGLNDFIKNQISPEEVGVIGRVITEGNKIYKIMTEQGVKIGEVKGKSIYESSGREEFPSVGDWVILDRIGSENGNARIERILQRKSKLSRKVAGKRFDEQIIATNIDYIFISMSLNNDFNLRRLERYLTIVWDSMAIPVILLTKADLSTDADKKILEIERVAPAVDILTTSVVTGDGIAAIRKYLTRGITIAFIGSSGVGKSSIINYLKGESVMEVQALRNDDKGRHTTTQRQMVAISGAGTIIDTPGMREIQMMDMGESLDRTFKDIDEIAKRCKFSDCQHQNEPGCAVREALESGEIDKDRWNNFLKMKKEIDYYNRKTDKKADNEYWLKFKKISIAQRQLNKERRKKQ
ncbi:MAG: ribosome small subunit-dependent GTPase A [Tissierellales bacterium]|nr:ribosome small subunit-dependent GTPase A [Tissierellales bacterium]MBN2827252.1 ribosome small subunit-dependent GTPase A [Tissierellales bacterium]